jgi:hypothetical protein
MARGGKLPSPRKQESKKVVVATRTSSRVPRDGVPIATKVAQKGYGLKQCYRYYPKLLYHLEQCS